MSDEEKQISIQVLEQALEVYEIESEQKLEQLKKLFSEKGSLDLAKMFYEERSNIQIKFQNIISDLKEFLVQQQVATTEKLRKVFYRILENPLLLLFKVSRFQIFDLRLNGFDIELEPMEAITELSKSLYENINEYLSITSKSFEQYNGKQYKSLDSFLEQATLNKLQDKIFVFYSYLRKGSGILKKKFQNKVKIVDIFNQIQQRLMPAILKRQDSKTVKQLSVLNYEIFELQPSFDVLYFYLHVPFTDRFNQCFHELELLGAKAKQTSNYNTFILLFVKHEKQIIEKLRKEKFDACYKGFIQNALKSILEMWGCRICYFKQFLQLFTCLFKLHPNQVEALQLTLKHNPALTKDDIVLLRTNFKLELDKKHNELLSLLKTINLEQLNEFLNNFYHKTLYNMNFKGLQREKIISLLSLMNGNSSLAQLFKISERALREWNHTIDFSHSHKFIQTQFQYPNIGEAKIKQCFTILTNLFALQQKGFNKEYSELIKAGTIGKSILQFIKFLQNDEKSKQTLVWAQTQLFLIQSFSFVCKTINPAVEAEKVVSAFTRILENIADVGQRSRLERNILSIIEQNIESFRIDNYLSCFKRLKVKESSKIIEIIMGGIEKNNGLVKKFSYIDQKVEQLEGRQLSISDAEFIQSNYCIIDGKITFKDTGIFNLSDLEIMTVPSQIDKILDNFYFTLDSNSKKFVEYLISKWSQSRNSDDQFYSDLLQSLVELYPITIPVIASTRISETESQSKRFIEILIHQAAKNKKDLAIILKLIKCKSIRYRNGRDYLQQEIILMALKQTIKKVNSTDLGSLPADLFLILAKLFQRANLTEIKIDTIQKSIQKIRFLVTRSATSKDAETFAEAFQILLRVFFAKKELDMKKENLVRGYNSLIWNEVRNYVSNLGQSKVQLKNDPITQYIVVSPFTITQEFNIENYRLKKGPNKSGEEVKKVSGKSIISKLAVKERVDSGLRSAKNLSSGSSKKIFLTSSKYDLDIYIGREKLQSIIDKQNVEVIYSEQSNESSNKSKQKKEQDSSSFIQYYMKTFSLPSIDHKIILENVCNLIKADNPSISFLWTNCKNLQNYFINLISVFEFASLQKEKRKAEESPEINRIVELVNSDSSSVITKILRIFSGLGYSNIWAQSFDMFWNNFPIRKFLGFNTKSEQSFLSLILKNTLEKQELRDHLTQFLGNLFQTRNDQNVLMYKVALDKNLMNVIMKSLSIPHLQNISLMFHSNFNNLRLYTDQLHEGLKALNIASKNRAYNEYIKISKSVEDEEFSGPLKLFKQNFAFFIRIEKQGYKFKKNEEINLVLGRLSNIFRNAEQRQNISVKVNAILEDYIKQITQLQIAIANRVKSFYLATKLRDLTYQNAIMIPIMNQILQNSGKTEAQIIQQIDKLQIMSLLSRLYNQLVRYEDDWRETNKYSSNYKVDGYVLENQIAFCTTLRFSHSMSKIYQKCDLEIDEVMQRCINALKVFLATNVGKKWVQKLQIYPGFLVKSFVEKEKANSLRNQIISKVSNNKRCIEFSVSDNQFIETLLKGFRGTTRQNFLGNNLKIEYKNSKRSPTDLLNPLYERLINNQTLVVLKNSNNIVFNKFKTSEATLEQIQALGYIISYALLNKTPLNISLHPSIIAALSFNIAQIDFLLDIDFKIWEELRNILSVQDSGKLNLNFSYNFESLQNFKPVRVELIDKGSSKKVNNLNRQQFCDLVCCYILYENHRPHIHRLLKTVLSIVPKQLISCMSTKEILDIFYPKQKSQKILDDYMKKVGVILPQTLIDEKGRRVDNLKDFQNIQWLQELILENQNLRSKYWKEETNLFVVTTISSQPSVRFVNGKFLVQHFGSKEQMKKCLSQI